MDGQCSFVASVNKDRWMDCGFCRSVLYCPDLQACIDCGVCAAGCPCKARELVLDDVPQTFVSITVDGQALSVPERIMVRAPMRRLRSAI
jgi:ferredoxin